MYSLPKGQSEAGLSVGLTTGQMLRSIQLPQALTAMLPALIGQFVVILKDSALGLPVTYPELLNWSKTLGSAFSNTVPAYMVAAMLFILMNYPSLSSRVGSNAGSTGAARQRVARSPTPCRAPPWVPARCRAPVSAATNVQNIDPANTGR